jgi:GNAT superfamily N-acetyltransferase
MDLLVNLYSIKNYNINIPDGVVIKRAIPPEKNKVVKWVRDNFSDNWSAECEVSFSPPPPGCFLALKNGNILGFCCYDATAKGFLGPVGILESERGSGIGKALLLTALKQMLYDGYVYAVIGWAGPVEFFKKTVHAIEIPSSDNSIYRNMLK